MKILLHIAERDLWLAATEKGIYHPDSLDDEGFIHCSLTEQVLQVANSLYRDRQDLILLVVDPAKVSAEIRYEDCYESGQNFPHIYGLLPVEAVKQALRFELGADGRFALPGDLDPESY